MKRTKADSKPVPEKKEVTVFVGVIFDSEEDAQIVADHFKSTKQIRGRVYAQAMLEKINRDDKKGRF